MLTISRILIVAITAASVFAADLAIAGDVAATVASGTLKIKGSDVDDVLTIAAGGPNIASVTPGPGTTINGIGVVQMFGGVTKGFKINLGEGADGLTIMDLNIPAVGIKTGAGVDEVQLFNVNISTKAAIDLGADNNVLELCTADLPKIGIKTGAPNGTQVNAGCPMSVFGIASDAGSAIVIDDVFIAGNLAVKMGQGIDVVGIQFTTVAGNAKLSMGADSAAVGVCNVIVTGDLTVAAGKPVSGEFTDFACDAFAAVGETSILLEETTVSGKLKVKAGAGSDDVTFGDVFAGGKTKVDAGGGNNEIRIISVTFSDDLGAKTAKGADLYDIDDVLMRGNAKFALGAGANELFGANSTAEADLTVKAGKDNDTIDTSGITVLGTRKVDGGGGFDTIN